MIIDISIIAILCAFSAIGYKKGLLQSLIAAFCVVAAVFITYLLLPTITNIVYELLNIKNIQLDKPNEIIQSVLNNNSIIIMFIKNILRINNSSLHISIIVVNSITFVLLTLVIKYILKKTTRKLNVVFKKVFPSCSLDRIGGVSYGLLNGVVMVSIICFIIYNLSNVLTNDYILTYQIQESSLINLFNQSANAIFTTFGFI